MESQQKYGCIVCVLPLLVMMIFFTACSADEPQDKQESSQSETSIKVTEPEGHTLPDFFPEKISLPDNYMIVRNSSKVRDEFGQMIEMNIALPGSIEKSAETYEEILMREFEDVNFQESSNSLQWRFHGQGFDYGALYLNENKGHLDRGEMDSSHLPVMLTLKMHEHESED